MRPVLVSELDVAVRALLNLPRPERRRRMACILATAQAAERHLAKTGRFHPVHGNGSLASAARRHGVCTARPVCDAEYLDALACVLEGLSKGPARI